MHIGLVLTADGLTGHHLTQRNLGDGLIEINTQPLVIQTAGALGFEEFNADAFGYPNPRFGLDGFEGGEELGAIIGGRVGRKPADRRRTTKLFRRNQPKLEVAAFKLHGPIEPVRQAHPVGIIIVIGARAKLPEFLIR